MYFEALQNINEVIKRGKNLKKWKQYWKVRLIKEENKKWVDFSQDWFDNIFEF